VLLTLALALSALGRTPALYLPIAVNFVIWSLLGFVLTGLSLGKGVRESSRNAEARGLTGPQ
jgi:NhaP-type Na+/H+ or K+/H+ antiporter